MNRSPHTMVNYRSDLEKFLGWYEGFCSGRPLHKVDGRVISSYRSWMEGECGEGEGTPSFLVRLWSRFFPSKPSQIPKAPLHLAVTTRRRHLSVLKNFFEFLKQSHEDGNKIFLSNPVKGKLHSLRLKEADVFHTPMLGREDWARVEDNIWKPRERLMIDLLYYGGLRLSELGPLKVENFDSQSGTITFERKGGKVQTLFPQESDKIFDRLEYWLDRRLVESEWVFPGKEGRPITTRALYNTITKILRRSGVPLATPHSFRKARATELYLETKDLLRVRDYLGHSDAKVTQTYIDKKNLAKGVSLEMLLIIFTFLRHFLIVVWGVLFSCAGVIIMLFSPFNLRLMECLAHAFGKVALILCGIKVEIRGREFLSACQPCIYASNHQHNFDLIVMASMVPPRTVSIGKKSMKWIPLFGTVYWLTGNILIDRKNKKSAKNTIQTVGETIRKKNLSVWIMPEGTRSKGRGILPFKKGAFHMSFDAGVPIVPVSVSPYESALSLEKWWAGTVVVQLHPPRYPEKEPTPEALSRLMEQVRESIVSGVEGLRAG